jgi:ketosteroid isomerase-like protein
MESGGLARDTAWAMSQENVEIVREAFGYWERSDLNAFMDLFAEDAVLRADENWPERVYYGKDAVRSFHEGLVETIGRDAVIEDLIDAGDRVVMRARSHWTGEQSGIETDVQFTQVLTFRKGKVVLDEYFWDHQEALEAAGLTE